MRRSTKEAILAEVKKGEDLVRRAEAENRDLTEDEFQQVKRHAAKAREIRAAREGLEEAIGGITDLDGSPAGGYGMKRRNVWAESVIAANSDGAGRFKSLTPSGSVLVPVPAPPAISLGQPVTALRSIIPSEQTAGVYSFLQQQTRVSNAAPVAPGDRKPVSSFTTKLVEDRARVIAHISEPVSRMDLADAPALSDFLASEMSTGLERAIEDQVINGDGVGENLTGLANTSGVLTVAFATDRVQTTRKAVTALELQGHAGDAWLMHPSDWETLELRATNTGSLLLAESGAARVPVESAPRRLWSRPVLATPAVPVGTAYFADFAGSTRLFVREEARIDWSEALYSPDQFGVGQGGTLFEANEVAMRVEARIGFGVLRPSGVVKIALQ